MILPQYVQIAHFILIKPYIFKKKDHLLRINKPREGFIKNKNLGLPPPIPKFWYGMLHHHPSLSTELEHDDILRQVFQ